MFRSLRGDTFLSLSKKVSKEISIGEALTAVCSRTRATLRYVPLPARIAGRLHKVTVPD